VSAVDAITAADSLSRGFAPGGDSLLLMTVEDRRAPDARAEEQRLRAHVDDVPRWLTLAETFYVDPGMVPLVCSAAAVLPDKTTIEVHDPPSPYGFALIGGGATLCHLQVPGTEGEISAEAFNALLWSTWAGQVYVQRFNFLPEQRWGLLDAAPIPIGQPIPPPTRAKDRDYARRLVIPGAHLKDDHSAVALVMDPGTQTLMETPATGTTDAALRWLVACWRLMNQTLVDIVTEQPTRQQRRQLERKNIPLRQTSSIRLRRRGSRGDGGTEVNWTHRWVVRGHWRQQRCKDENGEWTTRPVFIHPYIKGPGSAPLLMRHRVNHLIR
jgi:hypothetical protein